MIVIIITSSIVNVNAQSEEKKLIIEENIEHDGPLWYSVSCLKISCPGLALEIDNNAEAYLDLNHIVHLLVFYMVEHKLHSMDFFQELLKHCLLYTSPSPRDGLLSRMPSSA